MTPCIVCGLNDTSGSRHAASIASRLARDLNSRALLVNVREGTRRGQRISPVALARSRRARRMLKLVAGEHCFPGDTDLRVSSGHAPSALIAVADREDAELIVVGAGGQSTASPTLLGSVSTTLMREAPCPVVVVPAATVAPLDAEGMRSVVCGVADVETDTGPLRLAADLAARLNGPLYVVHAREGVERGVAEDLVIRGLQRAVVGAFAIASIGPPADALRHAADEHNAGLIVVGSGRGTIQPSTDLGSVPVGLAADGRRAVAVVPPGIRLDRGSGHYEFATQSAA